MTTRDGPRASAPLQLPVFARLAPALPPEALAREIATRTRPDDVVIDPIGRGGWVARTALALGRRAVSIEMTALGRLLADVVARPPDLRHLDAAFQAVAAAPHGTSTLRAWIAERFASSCPTCGRPIALDELTWEPAPGGGPARPARRVFRCPACLDRRGRSGERRRLPAEPADEGRAVAREPDVAAARATIRERFPVPPGADPALVEAVLDLHTPRQLVALAAILGRIDGELRASHVTSALRLALLHAVLPSSRLAAGGGRIRPARIVAGALQVPRASAWRERNPWVALEDGYQLIRGFVQALDEGPLGGVQARLVEPLVGVLDGPPMVSLRVAAPGVLGRLAEEGAALESGHRARVRLVLCQPPVEWTPERLTEAYVLTAWALGREAALLLPLSGLGRSPAAGRRPTPPATLRAALDGVAPAMGRDGRAVVLLDGEGTDGVL
ncbi:MAG: site-specific DNA-methyltransferase, partial [Chloroflexi bacterium]|nr:site-specific DNA-methyltransferase [Chloroflexota bacterium]